MIDWDKKTFTIRLNDFQFNAGVMGFLKILINSGDIDIEDLPQSNEIEFPFGIIENFEQKYIKTMVEEYKHFTPIYQLVKEYERIKMSDEVDYESKVNILETFNSDKINLSKASFLSIFALMNDAPLNISISKDINTRKKEAKSVIANSKKELKKILNNKKYSDEERGRALDDLFQKYRPLLDKIIECKDDFYMKSIMFMIINKFWKDRGFLKNAKYNLSISNAYYEEFVFPVKWIFDNPQKENKSKYRCLECGCNLEFKSKKVNDSNIIDNFVWINGMGIDTKKKTSTFWNFRSDDILCPICKLIYSCVPLGFKVFNNKNYTAMFINCNYSIHSMYDINITTQGNIQGDEFEQVKYADIVQNYLKVHAQNMKNVPRINGLQLIKKIGEERYVINSISPLHLTILSDRIRDFEKLTNRYVRYGKDTYYNVYQEVIDAFFKNINLNNLIFKYLKIYLEDRNFYPSFMWNILRIQDYSNHIKKGENRLSYKVNSLKEPLTLYHWRKRGEEVRNEFGREEDVDNKIRSYAYRLLNCIRVGDISSFLDTMIRIHLQLNVPLPNRAEELYVDRDSFENLGQAYIIGLITPVNTPTSSEKNDSIKEEEVNE